MCTLFQLPEALVLRKETRLRGKVYRRYKYFPVTFPTTFGFTVLSSLSARAGCDPWLYLVTWRRENTQLHLGDSSYWGITDNRKSWADKALVAWSWSNCTREIKWHVNEKPAVLRNKVITVHICDQNLFLTFGLRFTSLWNQCKFSYLHKRSLCAHGVSIQSGVDDVGKCDTPD